MTKPFFVRLRNYYANVGKVLRGEADAASIFPNTTDIGMSREKIYAEVLRQHIPSSCNVMFGGFLFGQNGDESAQLDIIITSDSTLQFNFHNKEGIGKSFACVDGCVGTVSVKSTLTSPELVDALQNIASIPDKQPLTNKRHSPSAIIKDYDDLLHKVVYASAGIELPTLLETLTGFYKKRPDIPIHRRPNLIHVSGKYAIIRIGKAGGKTRDGDFIEPNTFYGMPETSNALALLHTVAGIQNIAWTWRHISVFYDELINNIPFVVD
jgi:hypothetical protein